MYIFLQICPDIYIIICITERRAYVTSRITIVLFPVYLARTNKHITYAMVTAKLFREKRSYT